MHCLSIHEFDALVATSTASGHDGALHGVPDAVFAWLEHECLRISGAGEAPWLRLTQRRGRRAVQVTSWVGVIRAPDGFQIEVLPKIGKSAAADPVRVRRLLLDMLSCLAGFRHVRTAHARLQARHMPLLEIFLAEFLDAVETVAKHGLRRDYTAREGNLPVLRGKLLIAQHLRANRVRADRFFTAHDLFTADRPANRLLHAALRRVLALAGSWTNQKRARELGFLFAEVPISAEPALDFERLRMDRGMAYYGDALAWARLILEEKSPLTGHGEHGAPSLLFPMEAVFEAFVARHVRRQLGDPHRLTVQAGTRHLIRHRGEHWFRLKPDLLVREPGRHIMVLDTKWKLLDAARNDRGAKYGLAESDFYQLQAYGLNYLDGAGDVALVYPATAAFRRPLPAFTFPKVPGLRLWVLPFDLESRRLIVPATEPFAALFQREGALAGPVLTLTA